MEHPLDHLVPSIDRAIEYVGRKVNGVQDTHLLDIAHLRLENVLLEGPTGSAKTSLVLAWAAQSEIPVITIPCNVTMDTRSIVGGWQPKPDGGFRFYPGDLIIGAIHGPAVILWDEFNAIEGDLGTYAHACLDKRRTIIIPEAAGSDWCASCGFHQPEGYDTTDEHTDCYWCEMPFQSTHVALHPGTINIACINPAYAGMKQLNQATRNRFAHQINFGYEPAVERKLVPFKTLRTIADAIRRRVESGTLNTPVSTNMLMEFSQFAVDPRLGIGYATANFINHFEVEDRQPVTEVFQVSMTELNLEVEAECRRLNGQLTDADRLFEVVGQVDFIEADDEIISESVNADYTG